MSLAACQARCHQRNPLLTIGAASPHGVAPAIKQALELIKGAGDAAASHNCWAFKVRMWCAPAALRPCPRTPSPPVFDTGMVWSTRAPTETSRTSQAAVPSPWQPCARQSCRTSAIQLGDSMPVSWAPSQPGSSRCSYCQLGYSALHVSERRQPGSSAAVPDSRPTAWAVPPEQRVATAQRALLVWPASKSHNSCRWPALMARLACPSVRRKLHVLDRRESPPRGIHVSALQKALLPAC